MEKKIIMNHLSYKTEYVDIEQGGGHKEYLAFYFYVDGEKIGSENYNPADYSDILESDKNLVFIQHCGCGVRECSALVANVNYSADDIVTWSVDEYRYNSGAEIYHFPKSEYETIMAKVFNSACLEEADVLAERKKYYFLRMTPDACALFWDDNPESEDYGVVYGDDESITLPEYLFPDNVKTEISFNSKELSNWLWTYVHQAIVPYECGQLSIEELNKTFDWKAFHLQGITLALAVKKLLPENVILKYSAPFEDGSNCLSGDILIDTDEWYVQNVLKKLVA